MGPLKRKALVEVFRRLVMMLPERWKAFFAIVFEPWAIVLLACAMFLGAALREQREPSVIGVLTLMISLVSGVLGAIWFNRWNALTEEKVIVARGKTAVRSLMLLLGNIAALDRRVREYLGRLTDDNHKQDISDEVVKTYLEEVVGRCGVLEEETLSSIENWTDIVPGADIKTQIGILTELKEKLEQRLHELEELQASLKKVEEAKGESDEEVQRLRREVRDKERELSKAKRELADKRSVFVSIGPMGMATTFAGPLMSEGYVGLVGLGPKCVHCGFKLEPNTAYMNCPRCGENPHF